MGCGTTDFVDCRRVGLMGVGNDGIQTIQLIYREFQPEKAALNYHRSILSRHGLARDAQIKKICEATFSQRRHVTLRIRWLYMTMTEHYSFVTSGLKYQENFIFVKRSDYARVFLLGQNRARGFIHDAFMDSQQVPNK
ncbi:hypothetical protein ACE6H2_021237 [Prunus campanulata]